MLIALNKPFQVVTQFTPLAGKRTLSELVPVPQVYPAGRLDFDSEGLLLLTDDGGLQNAITAPRFLLPKRYLAQVEGIAAPGALKRLAQGVGVDGQTTRPALVTRLDAEPPLWPRVPPIRQRLSIPTCWLEITITEGRNRQVRKMTAAVGHPTLRLVRVAIGNLDLLSLGLAPGQWCEVLAAQVNAELLQKRTSAANPRPTRGASLARRLT